MDVLASLFAVADARHLLQPLSALGIKHRLSLFADDVALVICPKLVDISLTRDLFDLFGDASGLRTNFAKSSATLIRCESLDVDPIVLALPCGTAQFPCTYLGLPLSPTRLPRAWLQPYVDKLANRLPTWKGALL
jgi:hypothetical protein